MNRIHYLNNFGYRTLVDNQEIIIKMKGFIKQEIFERMKIRIFAVGIEHLFVMRDAVQ